ncbi:hypothetical protein Tco_0227725 [Tanacetum coccineum]
MGDVDIDALTMEQHLALTRGKKTHGMVKHEIRNNVNFEIRSQFMRELREETFFENKNDDAHEHIEKVLDILYALAVLVTGASQSKLHELFDVDSGRIFIVTMNTKEYHYDVLANSTKIMSRTLAQAGANCDLFNTNDLRVRKPIEAC